MKHVIRSNSTVRKILKYGFFTLQTSSCKARCFPQLSVILLNITALLLVFQIWPQLAWVKADYGIRLPSLLTPSTHGTIALIKKELQFWSQLHKILDGTSLISTRPKWLCSKSGDWALISTLQQMLGNIDPASHMLLLCNVSRHKSCQTCTPSCWNVWKFWLLILQCWMNKRSKGQFITLHVRRIKPEHCAPSQQGSLREFP